jgi:hypothetical protein
MPMTMLSEPRVRLSATVWRERAAAHRARLAPFVEAHLARRARGEKHPVYDFLFEYYSFRPAHLMRWSPGLGVVLEDAGEFLDRKEFAPAGDGVALDASQFPRHRIEALHEVLEILTATAERPAFHGCFGLHEWAMVYRCEEVRHSQVELRLSLDEIGDFVDSQTVRCSHYDAFRFFTPAARPLNVLQPESGNRAALEQRGCIHANMDLYKWAYKFYPWLGSDVIAEAFEVSLAAREMDMRASPYDLAAYGFPPIAIETVEGRAEYVEGQKRIVEMAQPVRLRLMEEYRHLLSML